MMVGNGMGFIRLSKAAEIYKDGVPAMEGLQVRVHVGGLGAPLDCGICGVATRFGGLCGVINSYGVL